MKKKLLVLALTMVMAVSTGCGKTANKGTEYNDVAITEIHDAVKEAYGDEYTANMPCDATQIEEMFGLSSDWYDGVIAEVPMMSVQVDTFVAVDAKDENIEDVKNALTAYQTALKEDGMQYPMNQLKIQASKVLEYGDKLFFVLLGQIPMEEQQQEDEDKVVAAYEERNQIAVDTIENLLIKK